MHAAKWVAGIVVAFVLPLAYGSPLWPSTFSTTVSNGLIRIRCDAVARVPVSITTLEDIPKNVEIDVFSACAATA